MEVVMESGDNGELDGQVYDAKVVYSKAYGLVSFTQSKLRLEAIDKNEDQFRFNVKSVVDLNEGIQYTKNMVTSACSTSRIDLDIKGKKESGPKDIWDKMPPFEFKDNIKFKILDSDLWQPGSDGQFLGTATVRGFPTVVYESQFTDKYDDGLGGDKSMRKVTVTKYYLDGDMSYDSNFMAKGAPVKIIVRVYDEDGISWDKVITMNMHSFEAGIIQQLDPIAAFDVSDCFNQPGQSQWFQMNFPETDFSKLTMSEYIPGIEKAFRAELSEISPLRMPKVLVDFDLNQLTITAKLLGRPSYLATFKSTKDTQVTSKPIYIIGTIDDCAKICENSPNCNGFSFCDESLECAIWQQSKADETMPSEAASGCTANQRVAALVPSVEPPMNQMSTESVFRIIEQQISLDTGFKISTMVTYPDGTMGDIVLGASELVRDVDPGWLSAQSRKGRLNFADLIKGISDFAVYARRSRLSAVDSDKKPVSGFTRYVGVKWRGCSNLCRDNPDCQMFSFCDKGDGDCVISTISSAKVDKASIETNTGCTVMQKSKIRAFMQYPSFSLVSLALKEEKVTSLDTCATKCSEETEFMCRSFDYCLDESSPKSYYCLMHEYHVSATAAQKVVEQTKGTDMKFNRTATGCIHYARQYSDDFKRTAKVKMGKDVGIIFQSGEMSLEMCSYHCSQNIGDSCQAFEFCDRVTLDKRVERTCQMTSDKVAASSTEMDPECSVYGRSSLDGGQGSGTRKPFASSGVAWFGAIVFLGIGSAIGFLVYKHRFAGVPA
ncbi:hypothetical protein HDE_14244 [Halotydeus destructor]|nr:hypothetical protein HDE_14244 [Halotydeus destructor]